MQLDSNIMDPIKCPRKDIWKETNCMISETMWKIKKGQLQCLHFISNSD